MMKLILKSAFDLTNSVVVDGDLTLKTVWHNKEVIRSLAGAGATDDQGTYRDITVTITKAKKSDYSKLENILSGEFHLSTENFKNYYSVNSYSKDMSMESESELYFRTSFDMGTKMRRKI